MDTSQRFRVPRRLDLKFIRDGRSRFSQNRTHVLKSTAQCVNIILKVGISQRGNMLSNDTLLFWTSTRRIRESSRPEIAIFCLPIFFDTVSLMSQCCREQVGGCCEVQTHSTQLFLSHVCLKFRCQKSLVDDHFFVRYTAILIAQKPFHPSHFCLVTYLEMLRLSIEK